MWSGAIKWRAKTTSFSRVSDVANQVTWLSLRFVISSFHWHFRTRLPYFRSLSDVFPHDFRHFDCCNLCALCANFNELVTISSKAVSFLTSCKCTSPPGGTCLLKIQLKRLHDFQKFNQICSILGSHKSGHGRRMLGSPRQLENAVPTNKNPHGVWVWKRKKRQTNYRCFSQQKETIILDNFWNSISFDACNTKIINWSENSTTFICL